MWWWSVPQLIRRPSLGRWAYACRGKPSTVVLPSTLTLTATIRDFKAYNQTGGHPDFQYFSGSTTVGLVQDALDSDGKPVAPVDPAVVAEVIPCPQPYGYRNRIMIRSQWNKPEQRLNIGFVRWDCVRLRPG